MRIDLYNVLASVTGGCLIWLANTLDNYRLKKICPFRVSKSQSRLAAVVIYGLMAAASALTAVSLVHGVGYSDGFWCAVSIFAVLFFLGDAFANAMRYREAQSEQQQSSAFTGQ